MFLTNQQNAMKTENTKTSRVFSNFFFDFLPLAERNKKRSQLKTARSYIFFSLIFHLRLALWTVFTAENSSIENFDVIRRKHWPQNKQINKRWISIFIFCLLTVFNLFVFVYCLLLFHSQNLPTKRVLTACKQRFFPIYSWKKKNACRVSTTTITDYMWSYVSVYRALLSFYVENSVRTATNTSERVRKWEIEEEWKNKNSTRATLKLHTLHRIVHFKYNFPFGPRSRHSKSNSSCPYIISGGCAHLAF